MDKEALHSLELYLNGAVDFETFEDRIVWMALDAEVTEGAIVFELLAEIIYVRDGVSDDDMFRKRAGRLLSGPISRALAASA